MALGYHEQFVAWASADAVTTEYTIGSLGFTPKAVMVVCMGFRSDDPTSAGTGSNDWNASIGFANSSGTRRSVASFSDDANAAANDCGVMARDDAVLHCVDGAGALTGALDIVPAQFFVGMQFGDGHAVIRGAVRCSVTFCTAGCIAGEGSGGDKLPRVYRGKYGYRGQQVTRLTLRSAVE